MKIENKFLQDNIASSMAVGKCGYYWESHDVSACYEVFMDDTPEIVSAKRIDVERRVTQLGINRKQVTVDMELNLEPNYHRIMIYIDLDMVSDTDLSNIADILSEYGHAEYRN